MFDTDVKLFEVHFPSNEARKNALVINGCNAYLKKNQDEKEVYSELEQTSYAYLNPNDCNQRIEVEFCFYNNQNNPYQKFWAKCYTFRTDNGLRHKVDGMVCSYPSYTKVSKNNEIVLGVGLYINNGVYESLLDANAIVIEGAIAIGKKSNVYMISVKLEKKDDRFEIVYANTFKESGKRGINDFWH